MKQRTNIVIAMMMEMCMWTCGMCMIYCAHFSDVFSIQGVNPCTA